MKKLITPMLLCIFFFMLISTFVQAAGHQNVYIHLHFNSQGQFTDMTREKVGASDEDATTRDIHVVYHILDSNGQNHSLWVSTARWEVDQDGTWYFNARESYFCGYDAITAFFQQHSGAGP